MMKQKEPLEILKGKLYAVMDKRNWSTLRLSVECGISYETLRRILTMEVWNVRLSTIVSISENLKIPFCKLFDDCTPIM